MSELAGVVIPDVIGSSLSRDVNGYRGRRVFDVQLPPGGDPLTAPLRALEYSGIPKHGAPHPAVPQIRASSITAEPAPGDDGRAWRVTAVYGGDESSGNQELARNGIKGIEVATSTVTARTFRDAKGQLMIVTYRGAEVVIGGTNGGIWSPGTPAQVYQDVDISEPQEAEYELPTVTVTVTRVRSQPSHVASLATATKVNDTNWSGLGPVRWLSLGIDSNLNADGQYDWRYIFAVAPLRGDNPTWRFRAEPIRRDDQNGTALRTDNVVGNGIEFFNLYPRADFNALFGFQIPG